jgi:hypothetical protein
MLWRPFVDDPAVNDRVDRNLYKSVLGNRVVFEEIHRDLELRFRSAWTGCERLGFVRTASLENLGPAAVDVALLDGLRNVLPYGVPLALLQQSSSLVDAYKRVDCDAETRLAVFSLTAKIVDRAEAAEVLRANTVWAHGLDDFETCLSLEAIAAFERGEDPPGERVLTGARGNYLVVAETDLDPDASVRWHLVADVGRSHVDIAALRARLLQGGDLDPEIEGHLRKAGEKLRGIVAGADGLQLSGHPEATAHHFANVLFNTMRGGVFANGYAVPVADLVDFVTVRNRRVAERRGDFLAGLPAEIAAAELRGRADETGDADLRRLVLEYLPIFFGRRHGDPSRPWNRFAVRVRNSDGTRALRYEGNWRDIFQNWEALAVSFPRFLPHLVAKFVNASTVDGFNPYRITRDGVDWEIVDPEDPWSYIGYWGDHQIVYLLKLLEGLSRTSPGTLEGLLPVEIFSYADVPYRLKPYESVLRDPRDTILYDQDRAARIEMRERELGTDGRLVPAPDGSVLHVSLLEKLLVPALAKLSSLVPDGGVWMNTQRPEWNDANNALVGDGLSMVTLGYLRRYLVFLECLVADSGLAETRISTEVVTWMRSLHATLTANRELFEGPAVGDRDRMRVLDALAGAFSDYRAEVYERGLSGPTAIATSEIRELCRAARPALDHALRVNRREDGLYHSYNLLRVAPDRREATVLPLDEMLEGQVSALSSGLVDPEEAIGLVSRLFGSRLYREDQRSFLLYPEKTLPGFLEKNVVPDERVESIPLLRDLLAAGDPSVLQRDALGVCRFPGDLAHARDLSDALERLATDERWAGRVAEDGPRVLEVFEEVFRHRSFTGRSGRMYGYEGLGCIYWHMVAKLLLAVQEIVTRAAEDGAPPRVVGALARHYHRIRAGLGFEKSPAVYGAFPTDPYSHTPRHAGAKQPGMTGQVKEEILTRFGELGVRVEKGIVRFRPLLLRAREFRTEGGSYGHLDLDGRTRPIEVPAGALAFSFCQVPVIYHRTADEPWIRIGSAGGTSPDRPGDVLGEEESSSLLDRDGWITRIDVGVRETDAGRA